MVTGDFQEEVLIFRDNRHLHHNIYIIILWVKRAATPSAPILNRHVRKLSSRGLYEYFSKIFARFHHKGAPPTPLSCNVDRGFVHQDGVGAEDLG